MVGQDFSDFYGSDDVRGREEDLIGGAKRSPLLVEDRDIARLRERLAGGEGLRHRLSVEGQFGPTDEGTGARIHHSELTPGRSPVRFDEGEYPRREMGGAYEGAWVQISQSKGAFGAVPSRGAYGRGRKTSYGTESDEESEEQVRVRSYRKVQTRRLKTRGEAEAEGLHSPPAGTTATDGPVRHRLVILRDGTFVFLFFNVEFA